MVQVRDSYAVAAPRAQRERTSVNLITMVGTAWLTLVEHCEIFREPFVLLPVDVQPEIDKLDLKQFGARYLYPLAVGDNQAVHAMVSEFGTAEQVAALEHLPHAGSRDGMAGVRGIGGAAVRRLVSSEDFRRLLADQLVPLLTTLSGGEMPALHLTHLQGTSGGMGSKGGFVFLDAVLNELIRHTQANIQCDVHLIGSVTYNSPDFPRVRENGSASVGEWLAVSRQPRSQRVTIKVTCHEVAPVGFNKVERDRLLIEQFQGLHSDGLEEAFQVGGANDVYSGPYGHIKLIQSDHMNRLPDTAIAADVAREILPEFATLLRIEPDLDLGHRLHFKGRHRQKLARPSISQILDRAFLDPIEELIQSATQDGYATQYVPVIRLRDGRSLRLDDVRSTLAKPTGTLEELHDRISVLKTSHEIVQRVLDDVLDEHAYLRKVYERQVRRAVRRLEQLVGTSLVGLLYGEATKIQHAFDALDDLQAAYDEKRDVEAKIVALKSALRQLREQADDLANKARALVRVLKAVQPQGDAKRAKPVVVARPLNDLLEDLIDMIERDAPLDAFVKRLAQGAKYVTPNGLAAIVGAPDATVDSIVRATIEGDFPVRGPHWGGVTRRDQGKRFIVFPPVKREIREAIEHQARSMRGTWGQVTFARTAVGTLNVVALEVNACRDLHDVWTPYYAHGLKLALHSHLAPLFVSDVGPLMELGLVDDSHRGMAIDVATENANNSKKP